MGLPWYAHSIKAYDDDTEHLTMLEHGAYRLMLDKYYKHAAPLPAKLDHLHRICRAFDSAEQAAVSSVLAEFFHLEADGWHNKKADEELTRMVELSEKRSMAAKTRRVTSPKTEPAIADTLNTKQSLSSLRSDRGPPKKSRRSIPVGFPEKADLAWAEEYWLKRGRADLCSSVDDEIEKFRDHHNGKLTASADWSGSWRTWARNAIKFNNGGHNGTRRNKNSDFISGIGAAIAAANGEGGAPEERDDRSDGSEVGRPLLPT